MSAEMHTGETPGWNHPLPARLHKPVFGALLAAVGLDLVRSTLGMEWPEDWTWLGTLPWLLAATSLGVGLARRLPLQNVVFASAGVLLFATVLETLNAHTGIPFGPRRTQPGAGGSLFGSPWFAPFLWLTLTLATRGVARLILKPLRKAPYYGLWVIGLAVLLVMTGWLALSPIALEARWWRNELPPGISHWHSLPWFGLLAIGVASLLQFAFVTPWLINKQPVRQPIDLHPLAVWIALLGWLLGRQVIAGLWPSAALTLGLLLACILGVWRGLKVRVSN